MTECFTITHIDLLRTIKYKTAYKKGYNSLRFCFTFRQ